MAPDKVISAIPFTVLLRVLLESFLESFLVLIIFSDFELTSGARWSFPYPAAVMIALPHSMNTYVTESALSHRVHCHSCSPVVDKQLAANIHDFHRTHCPADFKVHAEMTLCKTGHLGSVFEFGDHVVISWLFLVRHVKFHHNGPTTNNPDPVHGLFSGNLHGF